MPKRKTQAEFLKEVEEIFGDEYIVLGEYINNKTPIKIPKNINSRISPLLKVNIENNNIKPVKIQNKISSIYVKMSFVFIVFLKILKKSNNNPIKIPFITKIKNKIA